MYDAVDFLRGGSGRRLKCDSASSEWRSDRVTCQIEVSAFGVLLRGLATLPVLLCTRYLCTYDS